MEQLFTYGTLQDSKIQEKLFNRVLSGKTDRLINYEKGSIEIEGRKFNIAEYKAGSNIDGIVYELSEKEIERADRYEGNDYKRVKVTLVSGIEAWLYLRK